MTGPLPESVAPPQQPPPAPSAVTPELLRRVRRLEEDAARELVGHLYPLVMRIVHAHLPRRASEEDLAQEIFAKMFQHMDQYRGAVPFDHWVSRIAVNHCRNAIRAQSSRPEWRMSDLAEDTDGLLDHIHSSASPEPSTLDQMAATELVEELLSILDPQDRALIRWLEMEDWTIEEIVRQTGWSSTYIRVRAFRARRKLNSRFGQLRKEGRI
jgi:RNA polymerase sigma factor (sigma-70 family)